MRVFFASSGSTPAAPRGRGPARRRRLSVSGRFAPEVEVKVGVFVRWAGSSRGAEPKSRRCRYPGATDGRHGRHRAKGCPQIGSLQRYTTSAGPCSPRRARDAGGYQQKTSSARAYSSAATAPQHLIASAAMPVRRGARPGREHHHRTHTTCAPHAQFGCTARPRVADQRRRCGCCKQALGVVAPAPARVRVSQGPSLPRPVFRYTTERAGRLGGARPTD